jgi:hypothetical protein
MTEPTPIELILALAEWIDMGNWRMSGELNAKILACRDRICEQIAQNIAKEAGQ